MATLTLKLRYDPKTGKRELVVDYESERDALAHEHERDHRALVHAVLGEVGSVGGQDGSPVLERVGPEGSSEVTSGGTADERKGERNSA